LYYSKQYIVKIRYQFTNTILHHSNLNNFIVEQAVRNLWCGPVA